MKLRLHSNSVRFRLSRPEVTAVSEGVRVEEHVDFAADHALWYSIEMAELTEPEARFEGNSIRVKLPSTEVKQWAETDQVGIEARQGALRVLVEKDFKCTHRDGPEDADSFPNPQA